MRPPSPFVLLAAGFVLTACDQQDANDPLVGSWSRLRDGTTEVRDKYAFGVDGSFAFDENKPDERQAEDHMSGTYVASDGVVTATVTNTLAPGRARLTFSYYADETQFTTGALLARAGHTGIVGVWTGIVKIEYLDSPATSPGGAETEREFRADGSFRWTTTAFDGTAARVQEGTWVAETYDTFRASDSSDIPGGGASGAELVFKLLGGEALAQPGHIWLRE